MKVYYIYHSCYALELEKNILIFDYYKIPNDLIKEKEIFINKFINRVDKNVTVFSSHSHADHFTTDIFEWVYLNKNIKYILSDDIVTSYKENVTFVKEHDSLDINDLHIDVFGSTDEGVSFLIQENDTKVFHSGDLHLWHWEGDTPEEEKYMSDFYQRIIKELKNYKNIDLAFVPVDSRLGPYTYDGIKYFIDNIKPKHIAPMHFWDDFKSLEVLNEMFLNTDTKIIDINKYMSFINID